MSGSRKKVEHHLFCNFNAMPAGADIATLSALFVVFVGQAWLLAMATCPVCRKRLRPIWQNPDSTIVIGALLASPYLVTVGLAPCPLNWRSTW
jgi:hypothetical protein